MAKVGKKDSWKEYPDPTPVEIPIGMRGKMTMEEKLRRLVKAEFSKRAAEAGEETFEESNDFDVDDDFDGDEVMSPYIVKEMKPEYPETEKTLNEEGKNDLKEHIKSNSELSSGTDKVVEEQD